MLFHPADSAGRRQSARHGPYIGIVVRAVRDFFVVGDPVMPSDVAQTVAAAIGMQRARQVQRIDNRISQRRHTNAFEFFIEEIVVKSRVVGNQHFIADKIDNLPRHLGKRFGLGDIFISNVGLF